MLIYNVTVSIDVSIEKEWKKWMIENHIPDVLKTKCFLEAKLSKIHGEEEGGRSYSIMYLASTQEHFDRYQVHFAPKLQKEHLLKFDGKFAAFRTLLTVLEDFKI